MKNITLILLFFNYSNIFAAAATGSALIKKDSFEGIIEIASQRTTKASLRNFFRKHDIFKLDSNGNSLLHIACKKDNADIVEVLIEMGAIINKENKFKQKPLDIAIEFKSAKVMACVAAKLIATFIIQPKSSELEEKQERLEEWEIRKNYLIKKYTQKIFYKMASSLPKLEPGIIRLGKGSDIHTKLSNAIKRNDMAFLEFVRSNPEFDFNSKNFNNNSALYIATSLSRFEIVNFLMNLADKINVNLKNNCGNTALTAAVRSKNLRIINRLLSAKADPNILNDHGFTALDFALINYTKNDEILNEKLLSLKIINMLIGAQAKSSEEILQNDKDKLFCAIEQNNFDQLVLAISPELIDSRNDNLEAPMHVAVRNNNQLIVQALIEAEADVTPLDQFERTPLQLARQMGTQKEIINLLTQAEDEFEIVEKLELTRSNPFAPLKSTCF